MADETVSPTRMNLLALKAQAALASQGVELLKKKRDALMKEFFAVVGAVLSSRERLTALCQEAYVELAIAVAREGRERLESAASAGVRDPRLDIGVKSIWGVKVPTIRVSDLRRSLLERGYSPTGTSARADHSAEKFETILNLLQEIGSVETQLRRLGAEVRRTTRRVNALEQVVLPRTGNQIRFIRAVLEQREREDTFRLKRIKQKLSRQ
jgi:V/A-type H+-transporting ATPase subunit D